MKSGKHHCRSKFHAGFTLAELLICLVILGEIATFTIPKIVTSQQNNSYNAKAKEAIATIAAIYSSYTVKNGYSANLGIGDLTPYMNYIAVDSVSVIDSYYGDGGVTLNCNSDSGGCLKLHNGAYIKYWSAATFGGTATNNGIPIVLDPDGKVTDGTSTGSGKSIYLFLYYNGRVVDLGNLVPNTSWSTNSNWQANPAQVPPWFSW